MKVWRLVNILCLIVFIALLIFVMVRRIDGTGAVQTPEARMISVLVLVVFYIFVGLFQLLVLHFIKKHN